jgi:hypothetical protein
MLRSGSSAPQSFQSFLLAPNTGVAKRDAATIAAQIILGRMIWTPSPRSRRQHRNINQKWLNNSTRTIGSSAAGGCWWQVTARCPNPSQFQVGNLTQCAPSNRARKRHCCPARVAKMTWWINHIVCLNMPSKKGKQACQGIEWPACDISQIYQLAKCRVSSGPWAGENDAVDAEASSLNPSPSRLARMGDRYLRRILVVGAHSVLRRAMAHVGEELRLAYAVATGVAIALGPMLLHGVWDCTTKDHTSQGPSVSIRPKATCAAPLCEVLSPCGGR